MPRLEIGCTNLEFMINWLLGFGVKVKGLEPCGIAEEVRANAEKYYRDMNKQGKLLLCWMRQNNRIMRKGVESLG